jgi:hypothetical protein
MNEMQTGMRIQGHVECWKRFPDGHREKVVDEHNLVVDLGLNWLRDFAGGFSTIYVTYAGIGYGTTAPVGTDTTLGNEIIRKAVSYDTSAGTGIIKFSWTTTTGEANTPGTISEAALFSASVSGTMFSRATFTAFDKDNTVELDWVWTWTYSSA